jgi:hypothetical protein
VRRVHLGHPRHFRHPRHFGVVLLIALCGAVFPGAANGQDDVAVDPIRCWWRTSTGAVRIGETFSVVLTCAVLQNEAVQVVPDENRLDPTVIQMAPFEVVDGDHPADLYGPNRRFFQYEYRLRIINPDVIGRDVRIPDPQIHYRINSTVAANTALQGRDHSYLMPPQSVRVLSLVPADAPDIRDSAAEGFGAAEQLTFRGTALRIAALTAMALGGIVALLGVGRVVVRTRGQKTVTARGLAPAVVLRVASRTLTEVQREAAGGAWTPDLIARALAAARLIAAIATERTVHQYPDAAEISDGQLGAPKRSLGRRRRPTAISASATAADLSGDETWAELRDALVTFTRAQYSRDGALDGSALDDAVAQSLAAARVLGSTHAWPKAYLRRWMPQVQAEQRA